MAKKQDDQSAAPAAADAVADVAADAPAAAPKEAPVPKEELVTLKMPDGTAGCSVGGVSVNVGKDGLVKVPQWVAAILRESYGAVNA